jgi:hypothetical protein
MRLFDIFKKTKRKFVFDKCFKFEQYPNILNCHNKYNELINRTYDLEGLYAAGKCSKEEHLKSLYDCDDYYENEYARVVYKEFYGKGLEIKNWRTKTIVFFDEMFESSFEKLTKEQRNVMVNILEEKYCWKLPSEYYEES